MTLRPNSQIQNGRVSIDGAEMFIDGFALVEELGSGANGTVYRATDTLLGREVAIKVWNLNGLERSRDEISKIAQFQHPLMVSTYRFDYAGDAPYAVMELVEGVTGKEWLKKIPTYEPECVFGVVTLRLLAFYTARVQFMETHTSEMSYCQNRAASRCKRA